MTTQELRDVDLHFQDDDDVWLSYRINQLNNQAMYIPLRKERPVPKGEKPQSWPLTVIPVDFVRRTDLHRWLQDETEPVKQKPLRDGWLYIFMDGFLWRELRVIKGHYFDINLKKSFAQPETNRPHAGTQLPSILVPSSYDDKIINIQVAFSDVQWSWTTIQKLGGMNPKDPRIAHQTLPKEYADVAADEELVSNRLTQLDFFAQEPAQYLSHSQGVLVKEIDAPLDLYIKYKTGEEAIFGLPDLVGEGLDLQQTYSGELERAVGHVEEIQTSQDPSVKLARMFNLRYNVGAEQLQQGIAEKQELVNEATSDWASNLTACSSPIEFVVHSENLKDEFGLTELKKSISQIQDKRAKLDMVAVGEKLQTGKMELRLKNLYDIRKRITSLFKSASMVAQLSDYCGLASEENTLRRFEGIYRLSQILDGLNTRPLHSLWSCLENIGEARLLDQSDEVDTLLLGFTQQLTGLDLPGQETLQPHSEQLGNILFSDVVKSIKKNGFNNILDLAQHYYEKLTPEENDHLTEAPLAFEQAIKPEYSQVATKDINAVKAIIRCFQVFATQDKDQLSDFVTQGAGLSEKSKKDVDYHGKKENLDKLIHKQQEYAQEKKKEIVKTESKRKSQEAELSQKAEQLDSLKKELGRKVDDIKHSETLRSEFNQEKYALEDRIRQLQGEEYRLKREVGRSRKILNTQRSKLNAIQTKIVNAKSNPTFNRLVQSAHFKSNESLKNWITNYTLNGLIKEVEVNLDDLLEHRFDANVIPLDMARTRGRIAEKIELIDSILKGDHDGPETRTLKVGNRQVQLDSRLQFREQAIITELETLLAEAEGLNSQRQQKVKVVVMDLNYQKQTALPDIATSIAEHDQALKRHESNLQSLKKRLTTVENEHTSIDKLKQSLESKNAKLNASAKAMEAKTQHLIKSDMKIAKMMLPTVAAMGVIDVFNFAQKTYALVADGTNYAIAEFASAVVDVVAVGFDLGEQTARMFGSIHAGRATLLPAIAKGAGVAASVVAIIISAWEAWSAHATGDTGLFAAKLAGAIGSAIVLVLMLFGVGTLVVLAAAVIVAGVSWIIGTRWSDDTEDRYLEECEFGMVATNRFSTAGDSDKWGDGANYYHFKHWEQNPGVSLLEIQSFYHRPQASFNMQDGALVIKGHVPSPAQCTTNWKLQVRGYQNNSPWQTLATETEFKPARQKTIAQDGNGPLGVPFFDWQAGFQLHADAQTPTFTATLSEPLLQSIRNRHFGEDTYQFRILVKHEPLPGTQELTANLPAPARDAQGKIFSQWQHDWRRTNQHLHRASANDWWYSLQKEIDT